MRLIVNGEDRLLEAGSTVADLLTDPAGHAVALNGSVVPRGRHADTALRDGDVVEIVTAVQGG